MSRFRNIFSHFALNIVVLMLIILSLLFGCEKFEPERIIKVETDSITNVSYTSCHVYGIIIDKGEKGIDQHGFCWSISQNPTIGDNKKELGAKDSLGNFSGNLTGLSSNTTYYVKACVQSEDGVFYGDEKSFTTLIPNTPTVTTTSISNITENSAQSGGDVTDNGGAIVTSRGVCWSTSSNPTIMDDHTTDGSETGSFTSSITGLTPNIIYYIRAYATNSTGTGYGNETIFKTYNVLTDLRDGQEYETTKIGEQWWMAENLNFYSNSGSWYYENDSISYAETYGRLYTWETAKSICPAGWHLPTDTEWKELEMNLGMTQIQSDNIGWRGSNQGVQLSIDGSSRFESLPAGYRFYTGAFYDFSTSAYFWSSTEASTDFAWSRYITPDEYTGVNRSGFLKESGFSVRCVQD